jgi:hypothetical protein
MLGTGGGEEMKCKRCGEEKPYTREFFKPQSGYLLKTCRVCTNRYDREYFSTHKDKIREQKSVRYRKSRTKVIERAKRYYQATREDRIRQKLEYKRAHRDQYNSSCRRRHSLSPKARIEASVRSSISRSINDKRRRSWESIVGYSLLDLMNHLERQFKPGMTWDNYGEWQIDHKHPRSKFHYVSCSDPAFIECWGLKNLQPLWRAENIRKGNKING